MARVRVKERAVRERAAGALPPAGPVTTRRIPAEEAHDWRPNAKPLTLTEITGRSAREGVSPKHRQAR